MWSTGIPWEQEFEYVAACRTELQPGEPDTYIPPRHTGASPTDVTGFQIGSAYWNIDNLPDVCYLLNPPVEWDDFRKSPRPAQKRDESGEPMWEPHPRPGTSARPMLDFPILRNIDTICTEVEWEWLEFIMRLDPRLTWEDVDMRMEYVGARAGYDNAIDMASNDVAKQAGKAKNKFVNALQTRCARGRAAFHMLSWRERRRISLTNKTRDNVLKRLSADQIANNTTRGSTPGIINPLLPDIPANRAPHRRTQSQPSTPQNVQLDVQSSQSPRVLAPSQQARNPSTDAALLPQLYIHQAAPPNLDRLRVPLTVPSTQPSRKRKAPAASPTPTAIDDTRRVDDEPLNVVGKRAKMTFIDLTQNDEVDKDSESFPSNHALTSTPSADTNMHASQPSPVGPNNVLDTPLTRPPTGILRRTPSLSSSFPLDSAPTASTPTTITQPPFGAGAPKGEQSAAVIDQDWGRELEFYYRNDQFAPFTNEEIGQGYLDWGPTLSVPDPYPF